MAALHERPYRSIAREAIVEAEIKKSRFIAHAHPASDAQGALEIVEGLRAKHQGASHVCYAWALGAAGEEQRFSDDGEPSGTAGVPILQCIVRAGLTNALVAIVRYFGGTLLGAGGLVRAYAGGAAKALEAAGTSLWWPSARVAVRVNYSQLGRLEHALESFPCERLDVEYLEAARLTIDVRKEDIGRLERLVADLTGGHAVLEVLREHYLPWPAFEMPRE